ncbi:MAG: glycosyltransferase [Deltaproteobacteria bacterium]|nr:glycosyltransferase [Deltaproteobacteria bacterium]
MDGLSFVSFIIPARNEEKMIGACLGAINELDYDRNSFECILVDNGSVDDTPEIGRAKGAKVLTVPGATISALRNFGAKEAKGDFLAFIDADCVVDKNWLKNALRHFQNPEVGCVGSHPSIPEKCSWVQRAWSLQTRRTSDVEEVHWLPSMNILVRGKAFENVRGFNESLITCEDVDLCYRLKKSKYKIVSDNTVQSLHFGEASTVREFFMKERWRGQSNLQGFCSHGFYWQELPSLTLPVLYLILILALPITGSYSLSTEGFYLPFLMNLGFLLLPPWLLAIRTSFNVGTFSRLGELALLYLIYLFARTAAIIALKP